MPQAIDIANSTLGRSLGDDFFEAFNLGRNDEAFFQGMSIGIWSSILDENSCQFCAWADNRRFDIAEIGVVPPAHFGCRCIISYVNEEGLEEGELEEFDPWESIPEYVFPIGSRS